MAAVYRETGHPDIKQVGNARREGKCEYPIPEDLTEIQIVPTPQQLIFHVSYGQEMEFRNFGGMEIPVPTGPSHVVSASSNSRFASLHGNLVEHLIPDDLFNELNAVRLRARSGEEAGIGFLHEIPERYRVESESV
jgi:hypothetical protein